MPPKSRKPPRAINVVTLGVAADLSGTLATFMPMKSVFILAADEIPEFFPQFLIEAGPAATAVLLILLAAVFAGVSALAQKIVNTLAPPNTILNSSHFRNKKHRTENTKGLELVEAIALNLVAVLLVGTIILSSLFTFLILAWVIGSLVVLSIHIHRSVRRPPFATGAAEFSARFGKWVSRSTLWSTVAAAIVTLLISPPSLGMTGILLAAVLLARVQQSVAKLAPLIYEGRARSTHADDPLLSSKPVSAIRNPLEFLATVAGQRTANHLFDQLALDQQTWSLIGQPTNTQLSLVARGKLDGTWRIIRVFAHGRDDLMNKEMELRARHDRGFLQAAWEANPHSIWGIPTIVLIGEDIDESAPFANPTQEQLFDLQISWELDSLLAQKVTNPGGSLDAATLAQEIRRGLHVMSKFPGPHEEATINLLTTIDPLLGTLRRSPYVFSTGGRISDRNVLQHTPGNFTILDLSTWQTLPFGWSWPVSKDFLDRVAVIGKEKGVSPDFLESGTLTSLLADLHKSLNAKHLKKIEVVSLELFQQSQ
jgi:hypothetical protein